MYKIVLKDDRVKIYYDGELIGECESYELDHICRIIGIQYEEEDE